MAGANQKVMSEEEKAILQKSSKKQKEKREVVKKTIKEKKAELLSNYHENLPSVLDDRLANLSTELSKIELGDKISVAEIKSYMESPRALNGYSAEMLEIAFQYYKQMIVEVNKVSKYPPSIKSFCSFLGVSTATYKNWLVSDDDDKREICLMVDDYITDGMLLQAQRRELDSQITMYRTKAEHGMIEPQAPQVIKIEREMDLNSILGNIESITGEKIVIDAEFKEKD